MSSSSASAFLPRFLGLGRSSVGGRSSLLAAGLGRRGLLGGRLGRGGLLGGRLGRCGLLGGGLGRSGLLGGGLGRGRLLGGGLGRGLLSARFRTGLGRRLVRSLLLPCGALLRLLLARGVLGPLGLGLLGSVLRLVFRNHACTSMGAGSWAACGWSGPA